MKKINFNENWLFSAKWDETMKSAVCDTSAMKHVRLPHTAAETPFHYFDEQDYQMLCGYRRTFRTDPSWEGKHVLLTFEGAAHEATVYVNGHKVAVHSCGYTAFTCDITSALTTVPGVVETAAVPGAAEREPAENNILAVRLDTRESLNVPPFGNVIDYMTYGGLYRDVYLEIQDPLYITDAFVCTTGCQSEAQEPTVHSEITLHAPSGTYGIEQEVLDDDGKCIQSFRSTCTPHLNKIIHTSFPVPGAKLWDTEHPNLYTLHTVITPSAEISEQLSLPCPPPEYSVRFGFREVQFRSDGFYLNGERTQLRGLNRHQSFPYVGYAMPQSLQEEDAYILKNELGCNAVRTSHYPQSQYFLNMCDELGLLVFTELPGWQFIGDEAWKKQAVQNVKEMVRQYRNHPSIFLWGVRINESQDDDAFYKKTNSAAHALDPSRPTGGVRFLQKSSLLEDVYTYNDFLHNGTNAGVSPKKDVTPDMSKGYLISEYNGHMYPTKAFDCEEHRTEHVLRHLRVLNDAYAQKDIAGSFAWCMFDYNTHKDFGSGDRICYHGVMDMFRNPKAAAAVYASQADDHLVCELTSTMDIGEHPGGHLEKVYALTNADSIRLYKNDEFVKEFYPDNKEFPALPHPPVILDDFVGCLIEKHEKYTKEEAEQIKDVLFAISKYGQNSLPVKYRFRAARLFALHHMTFEEGLRLFYGYVGNWGGKVTTYRFDAMKNGKAVLSIKKGPVFTHQLEVRVSTSSAAQPDDVYSLHEESSWDCVRIRLRMLDQNGNVLPFYQEPIALSVSGPAALIGPDCISLQGGMGGTFVRTTGKTGRAALALRWENHTETISFVVS